MRSRTRGWGGMGGGREKQAEGQGSVLIQMLSPARTKKAAPHPNWKSSRVVGGGGSEQTQIHCLLGDMDARPPAPQCTHL